MLRKSDINTPKSSVIKVTSALAVALCLMANNAMAGTVNKAKNPESIPNIPGVKNILMSTGLKINHSNFSFFDGKQKVGKYAHDDTFFFVGFDKFITEHNAMGFYMETNRGLSLGSLHDENKFRSFSGLISHKLENKTTVMEIAYETLLDGSRADFVNGKFYRGFTTSLGYSETDFAWKQNKEFGYKEKYNYFGVMLSGLYPVYNTEDHKAVLGFHLGYKYGFNITKETAFGKNTAVPRHLRIVTAEFNKKLYFKRFDNLFVDTVLGYQLRHTGQSEDFLPSATSATPVHTYKENVRSRYFRLNISYPF